jgi:hypothetical protein
MPVFMLGSTVVEDASANQAQSGLHPYSERLQEDASMHRAASIDFESQRVRAFSQESSDSMSYTTIASLRSCAANATTSVDWSEVPVKRTFIHYDIFLSDDDLLSSGGEGEFKQLSKSASAPSIMISDSCIEQPSMADLHTRGTCSPCAYLYHKNDGCRLGEDCKFCHLCPVGELKKRKKIRMKAVKEKRRLGKQAELSPTNVANSKIESRFASNVN